MRPGGFIPRIDSLAERDGLSGRFICSGAGIGGNKIYDLYLRLEQDVLEKKPDVVVIYIGVNDVWHKTLLGTGTDPDKFERFYAAILQKLQDRGIRAVLCTPAVVGERNDMSNPLDGDLNRYSALIRGLASRFQVPLVDLRRIFLDHLVRNNPDNREKDVLTYDRVHMNAAGNQLIAASIWEVIKRL
jgi:lysophospholipase L1-like esterase